MNSKYIGSPIAYALIIAFISSSFFFSYHDKVFASLGFDFFRTGEDRSLRITIQDTTYLQNTDCFFPTGSIIDSCNSKIYQMLKIANITQ